MAPTPRLRPGLGHTGRRSNGPGAKAPATDTMQAFDLSIEHRNEQRSTGGYGLPDFRNLPSNWSQ